MSERRWREGPEI